MDIATVVDDPVAAVAATGAAVEPASIKRRTPPIARPHISLLSAFMMLTTWSTSSSNVLYAFTFGVLGVLGGPMLMLGAFLINWHATRWTVEAA